LVDARNTLGEGCIWDPRDHCVYWTDIEEARILGLATDGQNTSFSLPERAGFILPRRESGFIVGLATRIARADAGFTHFETLAEIEAELPQTRVNDAAVDPFGGIVFGTFDERDRLPVASLYRLSPQGNPFEASFSVSRRTGVAQEQILCGERHERTFAYGVDARAPAFAATRANVDGLISLGTDATKVDRPPLGRWAPRPSRWHSHGCFNAPRTSC